MVSERIELTGSWPSDLVADEVTGTVRVTVDGVRPLFLAVAPADDVDAYLAGVPHDVVAGLGDDARTTVVPGTDIVDEPAVQGFWTSSVSGSGALSLEWDVDPGDWALVVMNPDGSAGVQADVTVGAELPVLGRLAAVLGVVG
ncbi:MAG: hypothetical protein ACRCYU_21720, partial [Nocardioides sp.]